MELKTFKKHSSPRYRKKQNMFRTERTYQTENDDNEKQ